MDYRDARFRVTRCFYVIIHAIRIFRSLLTQSSPTFRSWSAPSQAILRAAATSRVIRIIPTSCRATSRRRNPFAMCRITRSDCAIFSRIRITRNWWGRMIRKRLPIALSRPIRNCCATCPTILIIQDTWPKVPMLLLNPRVTSLDIRLFRLPRAPSSVTSLIIQSTPD